MGKKRYKRQDVSQAKTKELGIPDLFVLNTSSTCHYYTVHRRYFLKEKLPCPACGSTQTRSSKIVERNFKDIILENETATEESTHRNFRVFDITFYQRYFRCDSCQNSVFPEPIDFAEKGCRYTNRLSDILADKTFHFSYKSVCAYYGVPASTASIGPIMRRRVQYREASLPPAATPPILSIAEITFYNEIYPVIFGLWDNEVYCIDILEDSTEETILTFLRTLDTSAVTNVCIDPVDSIQNAAAAAFPNADLMVADECILRYARNAMLDVMRKDGQRFPIRHKDEILTRLKKNISKYEQGRVDDGMNVRPRLKSAYEYYQTFLELMVKEWTYEGLTNWAHDIPSDLPEFDVLIDAIDFFGQQIHSFEKAQKKPPDFYPAALQGVYDSFNNMPYCIFEVLRARCFLTIRHDMITEDGTLRRCGINVKRLVSNLDEISSNIKERRIYDLE